ncbi:GH92 family glycosyl hydrolase [Chitinophaga silvisoli]|uniref:Glycoside hydrolase family 92 protein n=1 Tax=Chitinophaga silvisoli TaxID=2291814 RepID=A0A3E1P046_9BACT|nr:GH92 family glycosyl hydrolase [Chitinophaga silvisoli]RFM33576.1 glycoside hydrolase family 92 protein [Chitinophaga silvisoli]
MKKLLYLSLCLFAACKGPTPPKTDYTKFVKPNIGTAHSRYFFYTPAAVPFGMAKLAPSTNGSYGNKDGWEAVGYDERHTSIEGFPNFHEFQVGGIVFAPTTGKLQTTPGKMEDPESGYRSRFDHKDEMATAGYYSVLLKDYNIKAELTATARVGFHRYTFPQSDSSHIIFDIGHRMGESGPVVDAGVKLVDGTHIEGYVITKPEYVKKYQAEATVPMYFSAVLDKAPTAYGTFIDSIATPNAKEVKGKGAGIYLTYKTTANEQVNIKVGLSYTSVENARLNLQTEAKDLTFDQAKNNALDEWNEKLGRIAVEGGQETDRVKFYTGLFHALLGRGLASDVNGAYPKNDGTVGKSDHAFYNTDAIWGGYWNLTPVWAIAYPEYYADFIKGQLLIYKETGWLADGLAAGKYVSGVGTNFTGLVIAAAYNIGIRDFDVRLAYEAALKNEIGYINRAPGAGKMDVGAFVKRGFCPYINNDDQATRELTTEGSQFGTSHTLEYCFSSYAVAQFAKALGKTQDYEQLMKLSQGWKLLYDSSTKFIRPRDLKGDFIQNFDPAAPWVGFQEGNAWQYTFFVPHEPEQLVSLIGKDVFNRRLDSIFTISQENIFGGGKEIDAFAGLKGLYNQGNQPNLHISWLFNFSGRPDLTQKWVRAICNDFYGTDGIHGYGYGQDEDQGQMGAWYVLAGIGLFDVKGLTAPNASFQLASPLFDKITINGGKKAFVITAENNSKENMYIQEASLNGKQTDRVPYQDIVNGGTLHLKMGAQPQRQ